MPVPPSSDDLALTVRGGDYDRFLAIQLAPAEKRAALYVLTAFHGELARIAETVSEPLLGHIRLAWWREALDEIEAGKAPRLHPVVLALEPVIAQCPALLPLLFGMIEARAMDLDESLMAMEADWQRYLDATAGNLHMSWAWVLDSAAAQAQEAAIRQQARAYATIGLIRAIPYMAAQGFLRFPHARMNAAGVMALTAEAPLAGLIAPLLEEVGDKVVPLADASKLRPLVALQLLTKLYAKKINKSKAHIFELPKSRLAAVLCIIQAKLFLC